MLLYLFAVWQTGEQEDARRFKDAVPAGILYMPAKAQNPGFDRYGGGEDGSPDQCGNLP